MKVYIVMNSWGEEIQGVYYSMELAEKDKHPSEYVVEWDVDCPIEVEG